MAYITLEDDTGTVELLVFSNTLSQYGGCLKEGAAVVVTGRLSIREEKEPQIVANQAAPVEQYAHRRQTPESRPPAPPARRLYLRLPSESAPAYRKTRAILQMFPGTVPTLLYFADTKVRRGYQCQPEPDMLAELGRLLGESSVVLQ